MISYIVFVGIELESLKGFNSSNNSRGFSLLEVLVALTVAAIALSVLVQGLSQYANTFIYLGERMVAQTVAVSELSRRSLDENYIIPEFVEMGARHLELILEEEEYFFRDLEDMKELQLSVYDEDGRQILVVSTIVKGI